MGVEHIGDVAGTVDSEGVAAEKLGSVMIARKVAAGDGCGNSVE